MRGRALLWRAAYLVSAVGIFLVDQTTKAWAARELRYGGDRVVIDNLLDLVYAENTGIAFGQLQEGGSFGRWFFVALAGAATLALLTYFFRTSRSDDTLLGACSLLLAGVVGNLTDRARLGYVIDFIDFHLGTYHWPTFNVADAAICAGAFLLICDLFLEGRNERRRAARAAVAKSG